MSNARVLLPVLLAAGTVLLALPSHAQDQRLSALKSVSVELPQGDRQFPPGPGVDAVNNNCLACHSAGMILNQPLLSKAAWETEVKKMINVYKASVQPEDIAAIIGYLDATKGTQSATGKTRQAR